MRITRTIVSLLAALLAVSPLVFAAGEDGDRIEKHHIRLKLMHDGELLDLDLDDLEVGETRQLFTDSGKEVVVTHTEGGIELAVDGETIDIHGGHRRHVEIHSEEHGDDHHVVRVEKRIRIGDGEDGAEGDHFMMWHSDDDSVTTLGDGSHGVFVVKTSGVLEHLEGTEVWQSLDEATRAALAEEIGKAEAHRIHSVHGGHGKRIKVEVSSDKHE